MKCKISRRSKVNISITYETILNLIEDARKYAKENAIKIYHRHLLISSKSIAFCIGSIMNRIIHNFGVELRRINTKWYYFDDEEKSWSIDFLLYVFEEKPRLGLENFDEHDKREIMKFIRNKIYSALLSASEKFKLFDEEDLRFWKEYRILRKHVKRDKINYILKWKGREYRLPINHFEMPVFFHKYGIDQLPSAIVTRVEGKDVIDGGAFIGDSALVLSELKPRRIYAFEPTYENFLLLKETICLNRLSNVVPVKMALGAGKGKVSLFPYTSASFVSSIYGQHQGEEVEMTSVDEFVKENKLEVGVIKLDVEGSESNVIVGAKETIKRYRPVLIVSLYHKGQDFFEIPRIVKELVPEYKLRFLNLNREHPTFERILLSYVG
jgi:FkbM family methyltransferase